MARNKLDRKKEKGIKRLLEFLEGDGLTVERSNPRARGKRSRGDINLTFKRTKYPVAVSRKENLPTAGLEKEMEETEADVLMFRKNRDTWKVYMDLELFEKFLLNRRS